MTDRCQLAADAAARRLSVIPCQANPEWQATKLRVQAVASPIAGLLIGVVLLAGCGQSSHDAASAKRRPSAWDQISKPEASAEAASTPSATALAEIDSSSFCELGHLSTIDANDGLAQPNAERPQHSPQGIEEPPWPDLIPLSEVKSGDHIQQLPGTPDSSHTIQANTTESRIANRLRRAQESLGGTTEGQSFNSLQQNTPTVVAQQPHKVVEPTDESTIDAVAEPAAEPDIESEAQVAETPAPVETRYEPNEVVSNLLREAVRRKGSPLRDDVAPLDEPSEIASVEAAAPSAESSVAAKAAERPDTEANTVASPESEPTLPVAEPLDSIAEAAGAESTPRLAEPNPHMTQAPVVAKSAPDANVPKRMPSEESPIPDTPRQRQPVPDDIVVDATPDPVREPRSVAEPSHAPAPVATAAPVRREPEQVATAAPQRVPQRSLNVPVSPPRSTEQPNPAVQWRMAELARVSRLAANHTRRGFTLGSRSAMYSARAEFIQALRMTAEALDTLQQTNRHSAALVAALRALEESEDFVCQGAEILTSNDVTRLAAAHQTPVLHGADTTNMSALVAQQHYYTYAQEQLAIAGGGQPAASISMYGIGKIYGVLASNPVSAVPAAEPKAMVFHQAALLTEGRNYMAANELGVLLAKYGRYEQARDALYHGLSIAHEPSLWQNVAVVEHELGHAEAATRARQASAFAARQKQAGAGPSFGASQVAWLDPQAFAAVPIDRATDSGPIASKNPTPQPTSQSAAPQEKTTAWKLPWRKQSRENK